MSQAHGRQAQLATVVATVVRVPVAVAETGRGRGRARVTVATMATTAESAVRATADDQQPQPAALG